MNSGSHSRVHTESSVLEQEKFPLFAGSNISHPTKKFKRYSLICPSSGVDREDAPFLVKANLMHA